MPKGLDVVSVTVYANGVNAADRPRIDKDGDTYINVGKYPSEVILCLDRAGLERLSDMIAVALRELDERAGRVKCKGCGELFHTAHPEQVEWCSKCETQGAPLQGAG